jgi:tetratricopeptide (TPR) repeat protein
MRGVICVAALMMGIGCTSALKEPPPIDEIGSVPATLGAERSDVGVTLRRAGEAFAELPDAEAVARAQALYLEAARSGDAPVGAWLGAARATAWLVEHEDDGPRRKELVTEGVQIGQWCRRLHPDEVECTYRLALAVGQQARERSATAVDGLDVMVELLEEVNAEAPELDFAGGRRVLALVLLRAPGWPTGPGDPEYALEVAMEAAEAFPDHPPNQLVLGEALIENGRLDEARRSLERGIELASANADPEAREWAEQGEAALAQIR